METFQILQNEGFSLEVSFVPANYINSFQEVNIVEKKLNELCKKQVNIVFTQVESIHHERGKVKFVVSKLK